MEFNAIISADGRYRYQLTRLWDRDSPMLPWVMLNPSTADATNDDPTVRRCVNFAKREGYGGIIVVNLYALRSDNPAVLTIAPDPVGPETHLWLEDAAFYSLKRNIPIVAAWGAHATTRRTADVVRVLSNCNCNIVCLGLTQHGQPRHPLYLPNNSVFIPYRGVGYEINAG